MNPKIVAFVDSSYIPVTKVWLHAIQELGLEKQVCLVTLDASAQAAFGNVEVLHRPLPVAEIGLGALWEHRIAVLAEMLEAGEDVIHSDVDAIWLRDPWPDMNACGASAVFTQGTYWPRDVHEKNRVVVCCGLFYLAANASVLAFLNNVAGSLNEVKDDQIAINRVIARGIQGWEIEAPYEIPFRDTSFVASRHPMHAELCLDPENNLSVAILPHHAYPRLVDRVDEEVVVAHPLSGKTMAEKRERLLDLGLWRTSFQ